MARTAIAQPTYFPRGVNCYVPAAQFASGLGAADNEFVVDFGTPPVASATFYYQTAALTSGAASTVLASAMTATETAAPFGRNVSLVASGASTRVCIVYGWDYLGQPMSETITLNGATPVPGVKAFKRLESVSIGASADTVTVSIGTGARFGLPFRANKVVREESDGVNASTGTFTAGVRTDPQTATTVDPRGLYTPTTTPDAAKNIIAAFNVDRYINDSGNGGIYGIKHYRA